MNFTDDEEPTINQSFSTAILSDIISDVEIATTYDIFQLLFEAVISLTCILGSILTILVLQNVARTRPAQTLRLDLAVSDLMIGVSRNANALYNHSYYLLCATKKLNCHYEVDVVTLYNNGIQFVVLSGFSTVCFYIGWINVIFNNFIIVAMSIERCYAIYRPIQYKQNVTVRMMQKSIIGMLLYIVLHVLGFRLFENKEVMWKVRHRPSTKSLHMLTSYNHITKIKLISDICILTIMNIVPVILAAFTLKKLRKETKLRTILYNKGISREKNPYHIKTDSSKNVISKSDFNKSGAGDHIYATITPELNKNSATSNQNTNISNSNINLPQSRISENIPQIYTLETVIQEPGEHRTPNESIKSIKEHNSQSSNKRNKKESPASALQRESDNSLTITLLWCILIDALVILTCGLTFFLNQDNGNEYIYFPRWLSGYPFNFIIYNIRIPGFRKRSLELLKIPKDLAHNVLKRCFRCIQKVSGLVYEQIKELMIGLRKKIIDIFLSLFGWCLCKTESWDVEMADG